MLITRRLFVGIPLSARLQKRLGSETSRFEHLPIIPTRIGNFHVTLIFLGFVKEEEIPRIMAALEDTVLDIAPFEINFTEIKAEPADHPSLVWLTGDPSSELVTLRNAVASTLDYLTPESKSFRPHVTLAKVRRGQYEALETKPDFAKPLHIIEPVETIALYESTTDNGKRAYLPLGEFSLEGREEE